MAEDLEDGNLEVTTFGQVDVWQLGEQEVLYTATDSQGNEAIAQVRIVRVQDTTPPELSLLGELLVSQEYGVPFEEPGSVAADSFDTNIRVRVSGWVNVRRLDTYVLRYVAEDDFGQPIGNPGAHRRGE